MKSKLIKFGYKLWALRGVDGYPYHLDIYCGKSEEAHGKYGLGGNVVLSMVELANAFGEKDSEFFFDNYFSSNELLVQLTERKICATGTVKANGSGGADLVLIEKKLMEKETRGFHDFACTKNVFITSWHDNPVVQVISNCHQVEPMNTVRRRVKGQGELSVNQCIQEYNEGMGGVDQLDRLLQSYCPKVQMRKWWWALFVNVINASIATGWRLYQMANPTDKMTHLEFRRYIAVVLVRSGGITRKKTTERRSAQIPVEIRLDNENHVFDTIKQGRCRICGKNTTKHCAKCKVRLHTDRGKMCWYQYHNDPEL